MKKIIMLIAVVSTVFMFIGNAGAASISVPDGYTLLENNVGVYSSKDIDFKTFKWEKGDAAYIHNLTTVLTSDTKSFYLQLKVETDGKIPFDYDYIFTSKETPKQFETYTNTTGGYFWLIEDIAVGSGDKDYNDLWASISTKTNPVPVPAAVWLFGSGLVGLVGLRRSRRLGSE